MWHNVTFSLHRLWEKRPGRWKNLGKSKSYNGKRWGLPVCEDVTFPPTENPQLVRWWAGSMIPRSCSHALGKLFPYGTLAGISCTALGLLLSLPVSLLHSHCRNPVSRALTPSHKSPVVGVRLRPARTALLPLTAWSDTWVWHCQDCPSLLENYDSSEAKCIR